MSLPSKIFGGNNAQNENNLMNRIKNEKRIVLSNQTNSNGKTAFRHLINGVNGREADTRLYINCKRENVALLAEKFYEEFGNNPYYFKFFELMVRDKIDEVNEVLKTLAPWEEKALRFGYRLDNRIDKKYDYLFLYYDEAAEKMGCSREKIRQIIPKALEHFYYSAKNKKIKPNSGDGDYDRPSGPVR